MKLCRFQPLEFGVTIISQAGESVHPAPRSGIVIGDTIREIEGGPLDAVRGTLRQTSATWPLDKVKLLPPSEPSKIICLGRNFRAHAAELGNEVPKEPLIFFKPPSSIIAPEEPIVLPALSKRVDYEGEMAVVMGRTCSRLGPADDVRPYIAGYTCLNDVTARDLQNIDVQYTRPKGFDTFCPFGPVLETELDLAKQTITTFVNGVRKQFAPLSEMTFSVDVIIRWIALVMTLLPGDVISMGTPSGVGPLAAGDVVEVVVSGIGTLSNPVVAPDP